MLIVEKLEEVLNTFLLPINILKVQTECAAVELLRQLGKYLEYKKLIL